MTKERLEEIKFKRACERRIAPGMSKSNHIDSSDIDWLIEQVEQDKEYEKFVFENNIAVDKEIQKLINENKRYQEAIEIAIHNMESDDNIGIHFALSILKYVMESDEE